LSGSIGRPSLGDSSEDMTYRRALDQPTRTYGVMAERSCSLRNGTIRHLLDGNRPHLFHDDPTQMTKVIACFDEFPCFTIAPSLNRSTYDSSAIFWFVHPTGIPVVKERRRRECGRQQLSHSVSICLIRRVQDGSGVKNRRSKLIACGFPDVLDVLLLAGGRYRLIAIIPRFW
jgi:hypothetical protein